MDGEIPTSDQSDDCCVIRKLDDGGVALGGGTVIWEEGVQQRTQKKKVARRSAASHGTHCNCHPIIIKDKHSIIESTIQHPHLLSHYYKQKRHYITFTSSHKEENSLSYLQTYT